MAHVCPVWIGYLLLSPFRKLAQNPEKILKPYLKPEHIALDFGSAMGYFSLPMAKMVQSDGKIVCADIQQKMLDVLQKRARKAGVESLIKTLLIDENYSGLEKYHQKFDFILLFAVVHEVPDPKKLFSVLNKLLNQNGLLLLSEPSGHVSSENFQNTVNIALDNNFTKHSDIKIRRSHSIILQR